MESPINKFDLFIGHMCFAFTLEAGCHQSVKGGSINYVFTYKSQGAGLGVGAMMLVRNRFRVRHYKTSRENFISKTDKDYA